MVVDDSMLQGISAFVRLQQQWMGACLKTVGFSDIPCALRTDPVVGVAVVGDCANRAYSMADAARRSFETFAGQGPTTVQSDKKSGVISRGPDHELMDEQSRLMAGQRPQLQLIQNEIQPQPFSTTQRVAVPAL